MNTAAPVSIRRATAILVLVNLLWGISFPLVKNWQDAAKDCPGGEVLASTTLIVLRMFLGVFVLILLRPRLLTEPTRARASHRGGHWLSAFWVGFSLQVWGLAQTTPARSAFITSLGSVWVPLLAFVLFRIPVAGIALFGLAVGVGGTAILSLDSQQGWTMGAGEGRTLYR